MALRKSFGDDAPYAVGLKGCESLLNAASRRLLAGSYPLPAKGVLQRGFPPDVSGRRRQDGPADAASYQIRPRNLMSKLPAPPFFLSSSIP